MDILGALGSIASIFSVVFKTKRISLDASEETEKVKIIEVHHSSKQDANEFSHSKQVRERFVYFLAQVNKRYERLTATQVAEPNASGVEKILNGSESISFELLDKISTQYGINADWLKHGSGTPFRTPYKTMTNPNRYIEVIKEKKPSWVYFVRSLCKTGSVTLVFRYDDYRYEFYDTGLHLSEVNGATGEANLHRFHLFLKEVRDKYELGHKLGIDQIAGRSLDEQDYSDLWSGEIFVGNIVDNNRSSCLWWDDFADIDHEKHQSAECFSYYGQPFVEAVSLVIGLQKCRNLRNA